MVSRSADARQRLFDRVERVTEVPMLVLAVAFVGILAAQELLPITQEQFDALESVTWVLWALFAFELVAKTLLAPHPLRYLRSHWLDVLVVLFPFFRPLRVVLLLAAAARFWEEARTVFRRRTLSVLAAGSMAAVLVASSAVYFAEKGGEGPIQNYGDALWWAMATITTVGYGDVYPKTPIGRGVAAFLMLVGISIFGLLTARVAAFFVQVEEREIVDPEFLELRARLDRIETLLLEQRTDALTNASDEPKAIAR
jgi:voltage-gated potassium channel